MTDAAPDNAPEDHGDLDAIAAALSALRGRGRGPGWRGGPGAPFGSGGPFGPGGGRGFGPGRHGAHHGAHHEGADRRHDAASRSRPRGETAGDAGDDSAGNSAGGAWGTPGGLGADGGRLGAPARMRLLEALAGATHPLTVSEVADAIGVDQPRASRLIQQAVDLGLVRREADPDDARRTRVALTDAGAQLARGFRGQRREHLSRALAGFDPQERAELARLLTKLAAGWPTG
ncbi:MAG: MarR family winged helix-turn-helix transcriptional regulator [Microbacterium sp.]